MASVRYPNYMIRGPFPIAIFVGQSISGLSGYMAALPYGVHRTACERRAPYRHFPGLSGGCGGRGETTNCNSNSFEYHSGDQWALHGLSFRAAENMIKAPISPVAIACAHICLKIKSTIEISIMAMAEMPRRASNKTKTKRSLGSFAPTRARARTGRGY